jgi:hypothetical protein
MSLHDTARLHVNEGLHKLEHVLKLATFCVILLITLIIFSFRLQNEVVIVPFLSFLVLVVIVFCLLLDRRDSKKAWNYGDC